MMITASIAGFGSSIAAAVAADEIAIATITAGRLFVLGTTNEPRQRVVLDGRYETTSDDARSFQFELVYHPPTCIVGATIGNETREAVVSNCGQQASKDDSGVATTVGRPRETQAAVQAPSTLSASLPLQNEPVASEVKSFAVLPAPETREPEAKPPVAVSAVAEPASAPQAMARAPRPPSRPSDARLKAAIATRDDRAKHRPAPTNSIKVAAESGAESADPKPKPTPKPSAQRRKPAPAKPNVE
ncbi:hypothetical protein [Methylobacterium haplocladii]|uniref:hypothetical protein n=1 Tax=Methylobacterium haplocladii TaxID=1176176 RepID=UPI001AEEE7A2|nr:hypothetical protein [Methylobacterium haplocladii]